MKVRLRILCENTVGKATGCIGEHGFACLVETPEGRFLFDTGQGLGLLHNARVLGEDLGRLDGVLLSHGHFDHAGGLAGLLESHGPRDIWAHPDVFTPRWWAGKYEQRFNGMADSREKLEGLGARFILSTRWTEPAPGVALSGEIPRIEDEATDSNLVVRLPNRGGFLQDTFPDDQYLALDADQGLVLVLGCAHAGLSNILHHACRTTGRDRIHAVIDGTHLGTATEEQFARAVSALRRYGVRRIGAAHCTGLARCARLLGEFPEQMFFANVGTLLEF